MAKLPRLTAVSMYGLTSRSLEPQFPLEDLPALNADIAATASTGRAMRRLRNASNINLSLQTCRLCGQEIEALLLAFQGLAATLRLGSIKTKDVEDGGWLGVFQAIASMKLATFNFDDLKTASTGLEPRFACDLAVIRFGEEGQNVHKWFRGLEGGLEVLTMREGSANMDGRVAVEKGVEMVVSYLGSR